MYKYHPVDGFKISIDFALNLPIEYEQIEMHYGLQ